MAKIIYTFDTGTENFNPVELEQFKKAEDMAKAFWDFNLEVRDWVKNPGNGVIEIEKVNKTFRDILAEYGIVLEVLVD